MSVSNCAVCKNPVTKRHAPGVQCGGACKQSFHYERCAKLTPQECDAIEKKRLVFICPACMKKRTSIIFPRTESVSEADENLNKMSMETLIETQNELKENVKELTAIVFELNEKISMFDSVITRFEKVANELENKEKEETLPPFERPKRISYANIVKNSNSVVVVKPKNNEQESGETKNQIKAIFDPVTSNINGLRSVSNGGIVIMCKDNESTKKCSEEVLSKMGEQYEVNISRPKVPLIKIWGMSEVLSEEDVIVKLRRQNNCVREESEITVVNIRKNQRGVVALLEADQQTYEDLLSAGRVYIGWDSCRAYQHINVKRCFRCNEFNHIANFCKNNIACGNCAEAHDSKDCTGEVRKCVNCMKAKELMKLDIDINHPAYSLQCPVYLKKIEKITSSLQ
jgi:hypothetical protein